MSTPAASSISIAKPLIGEEEKRAVAEVLGSGMLATGPRVAEFEASFARYVGAKHAIATSNGTTALHAALVAMGIGPGDEVIVPNFTFVATANVVLLAGATPVLCDIDPATYTLSVESAERLVTPRTKAILPVHLFGQPADMPLISEFAHRKNLLVLGDAAQAHGAALHGKRVGSFGAAECFSFYPTKNMTTGEGGMVTTNDDRLADAIRSYINHGRAKSELGTYDHVRIGTNFRLTDVHAAIGIEQLKKLDGWNERRRANATHLIKGLADARVRVPESRSGGHHVYHQFTVRTGNREGLMAHLKREGIGYGVYYPKPLSAYPHLVGNRAQPTPHADEAARSVLSLPVHPSLTERDVQRIVSAVRQFRE